MNPQDVDWGERKKHIKVTDLDTEQAADVLEKVLKTSIVPFLWGPPGVGKSSIVKAVAKKTNRKLIDIRITLLNPVDLRGLPVVDKVNRKADWYPSSFLPPSDSTEEWLIFLDELNLGLPATQAAAYQLILDRQVGEYKLPPGAKIVAAGNRETDKANVYKLAAPLANRFTHFSIIPSLKEWKKWAFKNDIRPEIIDFLNLRPMYLYQSPVEGEKAFPSPRTWQFVSELLTAFEFNVNEPNDIQIYNMIIGTVGKGVGTEFIASLEDYRVKGVSRMVDEYIKTGDYKMPPEESLSVAFIAAIFEAYIQDRLDPMRYKNFFETLDGEEKKLLERKEKDRSAEIKAKRARLKLPQPNPNEPMATLVAPLTKSDTKVAVSDASIFTTDRAILFDNDGNVEEVAFNGGDMHSLKNLVRGCGSTSARDWKKGDYIQSL